MKRVLLSCVLFVYFLPHVHPQQEQLKLWFGQELNNFEFNSVLPLEDRIPIYDSEVPGSTVESYVNKGELLEGVDELQWSAVGEEYKKLVVVKRSGSDQVGYVDAAKVALFQDFDRKVPNLGIRKRVITHSLGTQVAVIEHHDLVGYHKDRFFINEEFYRTRRGVSFSCLSVKKVDYRDRNGDGAAEFVVQSTYRGGLFFGDGYIFEIEEWYALDQSLRSIFYFTYGGGGLALNSYTKDGAYELLDANQDGFYEMIRATQVETAARHESMAPSIPTVDYREWIDGRYKVTDTFPLVGTVKEDNLRVRSKPRLEGVIAGKVMQGEKVYITDRSLLPDTIGEMRSYWYQITNKDRLSGWAFGHYLDVPQKEDKLISLEQFLRARN